MARGKYEYWLTDEGLIKLEGWARDGLTNQQIADNMKINPDTLYRWIKMYSEISETLKRNKDVIDRQVENALLKRALGFSYTEITEEEDSEGETKSVKKVKKIVVPDTTAQIFWLKNRKPDMWRDNKNITAQLPSAENNLFEAIVESAEEDIVTDEIPEIEQTPADSNDMVER